MSDATASSIESAPDGPPVTGPLLRAAGVATFVAAVVVGATLVAAAGAGSAGCEAGVGVGDRFRNGRQSCSVVAVDFGQEIRQPAIAPPPAAGPIGDTGRGGLRRGLLR